MPDPTLSPKTQPPAPPNPVAGRSQRNRMLLAVVLLLIAVVVVLVKDRDSTADEEDLPVQPQTAVSTDSETAGAPTITPDLPAAVTAKAPEPPAPTVPAFHKKRAAPPASPKPAPRHPAVTVDSRKPQRSASGDGPMVSATRAVLPPLRVEVVAGDRHSVVHPGSNSMQVELHPDSGALNEPEADETRSAPDAAPLSSPDAPVRMSTDSTLAITHKVPPTYPALARQMKVQGAVVLDALIGKDGGIQDLHVVQGPTILADAAREAVRQWRFKPYYQDGQPVETQAHITVNFQISTN
jgi:TonB family protein